MMLAMIECLLVDCLAFPLIIRGGPRKAAARANAVQLAVVPSARERERARAPARSRFAPFPAPPCPFPNRYSARWTWPPGAAGLRGRPGRWLRRIVSGTGTEGGNGIKRARARARAR